MTTFCKYSVRAAIAPLLAGALGFAAPPAQAGDLEFTNLQGGLIHGVHVASDGVTAWGVEDGGRIRFTDDGFDTWVFQETPDTARYQLNGVFFLDDDQTGWAVGDEHTVLYTTDGGDTWSQVSEANLPDWPVEPVDRNLWDVHFVEVENSRRETELHGWITGREGALWRSTDGGLSWESEDGAYTTTPWHGFNSEDRYGVYFVDDGAGTLHGYVSGDWATVLHTSFSTTYDAGDDYWIDEPYWDVLSVPGDGHTYEPTGAAQPNIELYDIEVADDGTGYVVGGVGTNCGRAYKIASWTTVTWEQLGVNNPAPEPPPTNCPVGETTAASTLYAMGLLSDGRAIGTGYASNKWRSPTSGSLWASIYTGLPSSDPVKPPLFGGTAVGTTYIATGQFGAIHRSTNTTAGTPSWTSLHGNETTRLQAADFASSSVGWITGQTGRIHKTSNGGVSFREVYTPSTPSGFFMRGIAFLDSDNGIVVGDVGNSGLPFVAYTHAGGDASEWTEVTSSSDFPTFSTAPNLYDIDIVDSDTAWAVGTGGWVLHSDDGGETWTDGDSGDDLGTVNLEGVSFLTSTVGVVVGAGGEAWGTVGSGWFQIPVKQAGGSTFTGTLHDVATRSPDTVVAVGDEGRVFAYVSAAGEFQQVYQESNATRLTSVALRAGDADVYAGSELGSFVWYDGSWKEPKSLASQPLMEIVPLGDGGFIAATSYLVNSFDEVP